jgi:hypothetical protein
MYVSFDNELLSTLYLHIKLYYVLSAESDKGTSKTDTSEYHHRISTSNAAGNATDVNNMARYILNERK